MIKDKGKNETKKYRKIFILFTFMMVMISIGNMYLNLNTFIVRLGFSNSLNENQIKSHTNLN